MTATQAVFTATTAVVVVAIGLVVAGVAILAGLGWSLVTSGCLLGSAAVALAVALLWEDRGPSA